MKTFSFPSGLTALPLPSDESEWSGSSLDFEAAAGSVIFFTSKQQQQEPSDSAGDPKAAGSI